MVCYNYFRVFRFAAFGNIVLACILMDSSTTTCRNKKEKCIICATTFTQMSYLCYYVYTVTYLHNIMLVCCWAVCCKRHRCEMNRNRLRPIGVSFSCFCPKKNITFKKYCPPLVIFSLVPFSFGKISCLVFFAFPNDGRRIHWNSCVLSNRSDNLLFIKNHSVLIVLILLSYDNRQLLQDFLTHIYSGNLVLRLLQSDIEWTCLYYPKKFSSIQIRCASSSLKKKLYAIASYLSEVNLHKNKSISNE